MTATLQHPTSVRSWRLRLILTEPHWHVTRWGVEVVWEVRRLSSLLYCSHPSGCWQPWKVDGERDAITSTLSHLSSYLPPALPSGCYSEADLTLSCKIFSLLLHKRIHRKQASQSRPLLKKTQENASVINAAPVTIMKTHTCEDRYDLPPSVLSPLLTSVRWSFSLLKSTRRRHWSRRASNKWNPRRRCFDNPNTSQGASAFLVIVSGGGGRRRAPSGPPPRRSCPHLLHLFPLSLPTAPRPPAAAQNLGCAATLLPAGHAWCRRSF